MDYTTLVERLLDGTITAVEQAELDRMRLSSPEIDREVRSLLEVEQLLRQKADEEDTRSLAFRESVRSGLKVSLGLTAAAAAEAQAPSVVATVAKTAVTLSGPLRVLLVSLCVLAGAGAGYMWLRTPDHQAPVADAQLSTPAIAEHLPAEIAPVDQPVKQPAEQLAVESTEEPRDVRPFADVTPARTQSDNGAPVAPPTEVQGTTDGNSSKNKQYSALVQQKLGVLAEQEKTSRASAAATARQIALLYGKLDDLSNARRYFDMARGYAQDASVKEIEGEILGDYALFELRHGNTTAAAVMAADALRILRSVQSAKLSHWEAELQQLTR